MPSTFTNTIHIRDFVLNVVSARTPSGNIDIHADVNVFSEDQCSDSTVIVEPIHTCIHAYLTSGERPLYVPDAFFYAEGRFHTIITEENKLEIVVQTHSLNRCDCFAVSVPTQ